MPLPNPDYLALAYYNWNGNQFDAAIIDATAGGSPAISTGRRDIRWDSLNNIDKAVVHNLIMGYATRDGKAESAALTITTLKGYQVVNYLPNLAGGSVAGLADGVTYTASVVSNGTTYPISIVGVATDTVAQLIVKINADLVGAPQVFLNSAGNLEIPTLAAGAGQDVELFDQNLFRSITGFRAIEEKRVGIDSLNDVFDLNFRDGYQSYAELLIGSLRITPEKPSKNPTTDTDVYFNHSTAVWTYLYSDVAVP